MTPHPYLHDGSAQSEMISRSMGVGRVGVF